MIDASLFLLMTFYSIIVWNPITRSASSSLCPMQSQITCLKMVIECERNNLSLPLLSLSHASPPDEVYGFLPDMRVDRRSLMSMILYFFRWIDWPTLSLQIKVQAVFDNASIFATHPYSANIFFTVYMFPCAAILVCADVNTSKDRSLRTGCQPELQLLLALARSHFFHSTPFGVMYSLLLSHPRLVNQQLSCTTFNVDKTCCGCFIRADGYSLHNNFRQSHPIIWCNRTVML